MSRLLFDFCRGSGYIRDLAGVGSRGLPETVLTTNGDTFAQVLADMVDID